MSKYHVAWTARFKKDYKNAIKCGKDIERLDDVTRMIANGENLPASLQDHKLSGSL